MKRLLFVLLLVAGCSAHPPALVAPTAAGTLQAHGATLVDTSPKEDLRLVPPEVYLRTYMHLFGDLAPLAVQERAQSTDKAQLFDKWEDYIAALGFPDYRMDQPRQTQTNAIMMAAFERLGIALCDRTLDHDWNTPGVKPAERIVFAFEPPKTEIDLATFTARFDVMHRTFLGYPANLAPTPRTARFFQLYRDAASDQAKAAASSIRIKRRLSPPEAGWAAVCYGLIRHPEFHLY